MIGNDKDEIVIKLFNYVLRRDQQGSKTISGSEFLFDFFDRIFYKFHKGNLNCAGSYIDYPNKIKNKGTTLNEKSNDSRFFQYAVTVELNHDNTGVHPERIAKIIPLRIKDIKIMYININEKT